MDLWPCPGSVRDHHGKSGIKVLVKGLDIFFSLTDQISIWSRVIMKYYRVSGSVPAPVTRVENSEQISYSRKLRLAIMHTVHKMFRWRQINSIYKPVVVLPGSICSTRKCSTRNLFFNKPRLTLRSLSVLSGDGYEIVLTPWLTRDCFTSTHGGLEVRENTLCFVRL